MIKGKLLLCAEGVAIDRQSNNATIFNVIEQLNFRKLPVVLPRLTILSIFERDDVDAETWDGEVSVCLNRDEIANRHIPVEFQGRRRARFILKLGGFGVNP